jgi:hypothetical protein
MKSPSKVATLQEVRQHLSVQLRRGDALSDKDFIKLLKVYAALSGWWNKEPAQSQASKADVIKTPSPLEQVLEEERKRRAKG